MWLGIGLKISATYRKFINSNDPYVVTDYVVTDYVSETP